MAYFVFILRDPLSQVDHKTAASVKTFESVHRKTGQIGGALGYPLQTKLICFYSLLTITTNCRLLLV